MTGPGEHGPDGGGRREPPDGRPGYAGDLPHVYNPYGGVAYPSTYPVPPAGLGPDVPTGPVRRPAAVHGALLLLVLAAVPYLFSGLLMALGPEQVVTAVPESQLEPLRAAGIDPLRVVRDGGVVLLAIALGFVLLAVLAWRGRRWARALVAATTVGFGLMVAVVLVGAAGQGAAAAGASLLVVAAPVALAAVGVLLLFGRAARGWFDRPRP